MLILYAVLDLVMASLLVLFLIGFVQLALPIVKDDEQPDNKTMATLAGISTLPLFAFGLDGVTGLIIAAALVWLAGLVAWRYDSELPYMLSIFSSIVRFASWVFFVGTALLLIALTFTILINLVGAVALLFAQ